MRLSIKLIVMLHISLIYGSHVTAASGIKDAVVKIYTVSSRYNYYEPWQMRGQVSGTGSGCIISGNRILTNAHVVSDHTFIQVKRSGMARKYIAKVESIGHECDLAILRVMDESFFSGARPIKIGKLSEIRDKVAVYGFPKGGDELSITEGVVSRIEHRNYSHSNAYLLSCQIDAAINSGNSGGPVIKGDRIVGVAFQTSSSGQNIGYMIPAPVILHFLKDIKNGRYNGTPGLGISLQKMENPDLRKRYKMERNQTGVLINRIFDGSSVSGFLKVGDIILSIDGINVENDSSIEFREGERTSYKYVVQQKYINDKIRIKVLRNGKVKVAVFILKASINSWRLVPYEQYGVSPTYYIRGGMVFERITKNFLKEWGSKWYNKAPIVLLNYYYYGIRNEQRKEVIVLVKVLADEINVGYHGWGSMVISSVNGKKISSIEDLVLAFENNRGKYHTVIDERGYKIVLDREKIDRNNMRILKRYRISRDRSDDLKNIEKK